MTYRKWQHTSDVKHLTMTLEFNPDTYIGDGIKIVGLGNNAECFS